MEQPLHSIFKLRHIFSHPLKLACRLRNYGWERDYEPSPAYAIFPIHPVSAAFLDRIVTQSQPDAHPQIIGAQDFTSWTYESLAAWSAENLNPSSPFQPSVFVVVDDRSEAENSIVIVSVAKDNLSHILGSVRADMYFASLIPSLMDSEWNFIEDWIERAQESGGILRDISIWNEGPEEPSEPSPTVSEFPDLPWELDSELTDHPPPSGSHPEHDDSARMDVEFWTETLRP